MLGRRYRSREASDHFRELLDAAEAGATAVVLRSRPLAVVDAAVLEDLLADQAPIDVVSSVTGDQVAFWLADGLVHAVGHDLDEATEAFLDALVDYARCWFDDLRDASNHAHNRLLALRVALHCGDRDELRRVVFGD